MQGVNVTTTQNLPGGITNTRGPDYVGTSGVNIAGGSNVPGVVTESGRTNVNLTTGTVSKEKRSLTKGKTQGRTKGSKVASSEDGIVAY